MARVFFRTVALGAVLLVRRASAPNSTIGIGATVQCIASIALRIAQWTWRCRADWKPESWNLYLVVRHEGRVMGAQDVGARDFARLGEVSTGSWLGREYQGRGFGTEMRAAVLALAFDGLGALTAASGAREENAASLGVSHALGYRDNGTQRVLMGDQPATEIRLLLDRETWEERHTRPPYPDWVEIEGLEPCLDMFGVERASPAPVP